MAVERIKGQLFLRHADMCLLSAFGNGLPSPPDTSHAPRVMRG